MTRLLHIDYIKTIAIFMVVVFHCRTFEDVTIIKSFAVMGPAVFFAVNGFLMLSKERKPSYFYKKNLKLIFLIPLWGGVSACTSIIYNNEPLNVIDIVRHVGKLELGYSNYMWFLVALFCLNVLCPLLQKFIDSKENLIYVTVIAIAFSLFGRFAWKLNPFNFMGSIGVFYYVFGYLILGKGILKRFNVATLCAAIAIGVFLYAMWVDVFDYKPSILGLEYYSYFLAIPILALVELLSRVKWREQKLLSYISANTLGIYVLQGPIYKGLQTYFPWVHDLHILFPIITILLCVIVIRLFKTNRVTSFIISI